MKHPAKLTAKLTAKLLRGGAPAPDFGHDYALLAKRRGG